jgi:hypothetical protein
MVLIYVEGRNEGSSILMIIGSDALGTESRKLYSPVGTEVAFLFILHHFNQLGAGGETLVGKKRECFARKQRFGFPSGPTIPTIATNVLEWVSRGYRW